MGGCRAGHDGNLPDSVGAHESPCTEGTMPCKKEELGLPLPSAEPEIAVLERLLCDLRPPLGKDLPTC